MLSGTDKTIGLTEGYAAFFVIIQQQANSTDVSVLSCLSLHDHAHIAWGWYWPDIFMPLPAASENSYTAALCVASHADVEHLSSYLSCFVSCASLSCYYIFISLIILTWTYTLNIQLHKIYNIFTYKATAVIYFCYLCVFWTVIEEGGVKMKLTVVDTPGFGDQINNDNW